MKTEDALYHAVHDYPGGVEALAARMGIKAPTLYSMANTTLESHPWNLPRMRQVVSLTGDKRPAHAFCEEVGGVFVGLPPASDDHVHTVTERLADMAAEFGDVARGAADAMRDGRITQAELSQLDTQVFELITAAAAVARQLRSDAEGGKPVLRVAK